VALAGLLALACLVAMIGVLVLSSASSPKSVSSPESTSSVETVVSPCAGSLRQRTTSRVKAPGALASSSPPFFSTRDPATRRNAPT
ncbi:unnamed protein product, partial [Ectocarpus sp. 13 AM-2016]